MDVLWPGSPGEVYANTGGTIVYQFVCSFVNTCGACAQYHLAIARWWPRMHHGCGCSSIPIYPGAASKPYEDWKVIADALPPDQQKKLVGDAAWKLIQGGDVQWGDVVTSTRVRSLQEVVSRQGLTVKQMTGAGIRGDVADRAFQAVNTPEHLLIDQMRADLVRQIDALGIQPQTLAEMFGEQMARRVGIGGGPSKGWAMPTDSYRGEDDWIALLLAQYRADLSHVDLTIKFTPQVPSQDELDRLTGLLASDPVGWLASINAGLRAGTIYPPSVFDQYRQLGGVVPD